ncbi:MAG: hypothetical protein O2800_01140 [Planctomycetota bacterium]|nr:hypothetical protein [Planctomycetota bacterium]
MHGISLTDIRGHRFRESEIVATLRTCRAVIAHNAPFDRSMMRRHYGWMTSLPWCCSCSTALPSEFDPWG